MEKIKAAEHTSSKFIVVLTHNESTPACRPCIILPLEMPTAVPDTRHCYAQVYALVSSVVFGLENQIRLSSGTGTGVQYSCVQSSTQYE